MDAARSAVFTSASNSTPSSTLSSACSLQYQLAYEKEKLSELRRQVAVQEERFSSMQQQLETLSTDNDTAGWKCGFCKNSVSAYFK